MAEALGQVTNPDRDEPKEVVEADAEETVAEDPFDQDEIDRLMAAAAAGSTPEAEPEPEVESKVRAEEDIEEDEIIEAVEVSETDELVDESPEPEPQEDEPEAEPEECEPEIEPAIESPSQEEFVMPSPLIDIELPCSSPQTIEEILSALAAGELIDSEEDRDYFRQRKINGVVKKLEILIAQAVASIPADSMPREDIALAVRRTIGRLCEKYGLFG